MKTLPFAIAVFFFSFGLLPVRAQMNFEGSPVNYEKTPAKDRIAELQGRIDKGEIKLKYDDEQGYLRAVLEQLGISPSSQMLVFSKTSFQRQRISPHTPRALYFNDDVYIGWVQGGDVLEVASADPNLGAVYYTLDQSKSDRPKFIRDRGQCLVCHASSRTEGVPGQMVRSVFAGRSGEPYFGSGTFTTDHHSPLNERWGGWYVTGTHGTSRHMGNVVAHDAQNPENLDRESGANVTDLSGKMDVEPYLTPHSDIVALMVFEHQTRMQNLITFANFDTRTALYYDKAMNSVLKRPEDERSESTNRRIASAGDKLIEYMLFADEFPLPNRIEGTSDFEKQFSELGPRDKKGRSLRDFDLRKRMMKYPCSYQIYSKQFDGLPKEMKEYIYERLYEILREDIPEESFDHLSRRDRKAIYEILRDTKPDLPAYWRE